MKVQRFLLSTILATDLRVNMGGGWHCASIWIKRVLRFTSVSQDFFPNWACHIFWLIHYNQNLILESESANEVYFVGVLWACHILLNHQIYLSLERLGITAAPEARERVSCWLGGARPVPLVSRHNVTSLFWFWCIINNVNISWRNRTCESTTKTNN